MNTRHIFWSGGWDSTYRLLYVLLVRGEAVQPHYVVRLERKSTHKELAVQARVRARLVAEHPEAAARLLPTRIMESSTLPINPLLKALFFSLRRSGFTLYFQYLDMAYYADYVTAGAPHPPFELGIIDGGEFHKSFRETFALVDFDGEQQLCIPARKSDPAFAFFRFFSLPIVTYTKPQMGEMARAYGFGSLLHESWFCHRPLAGNIPCGTCHPCLDARDYGMSYRLHTLSHLLYYVRKYAYLPVRHLFIRPPKPKTASPQVSTTHQQ